MDTKGNNCLPNHLYSCRFLCWYVWCWRWHRQGASYVGYGGPSTSFISILSMYDSVHKFYCNYLFCSLWITYSRLCSYMSHYRIYIDFGWTGCIELFDGKISKELLHCLLNWWGRPPFCFPYDNPIDGQHCRRRRTKQRGDMWSRQMKCRSHL